MRRSILATCLVVSLVRPSYGQLSTVICTAQGVCISMPIPRPTPAPPTGGPPQSMPGGEPQDSPSQAQTTIMRSKSNHTKAIIITAVVSAVGTLILIKLLRRTPKGGK